MLFDVRRPQCEPRFTADTADGSGAGGGGGRWAPWPGRSHLVRWGCRAGHGSRRRPRHDAAGWPHATPDPGRATTLSHAVALATQEHRPINLGEYRVQKPDWSVSDYLCYI